MNDNQLNSIIQNIMDVSPSMKILRVRPDGWELSDFLAGQFVTLGLPGSAERISDAGDDREPLDPDKLIRRAYSIASSSKSREYIEFYITVVRSGALTPRIFNLKIGDRIEMGKRGVGMFTLDEVPDSMNVILIATGTGVAPYMSMIRSNALNSGKGKLMVIQGAAHTWDLGYFSEMNLIQSMSDKFVYVPTVLDAHKEPVEWYGETHFIEDMWKNGVVEKYLHFKPASENTHIFLCGNPNMTSSMKEILEKEGYSENTKRAAGQIHIEKW